MAGPSIKGSAFQSVVQHVRDAVASGALSRDELASRLEPGQIDIIEGEIDAGRWYDVRLHDRLLAVLRDVRGLDDVRMIGQTSARLLAEAGIYQQMDYLNRMELDKATSDEARFRAYGRDLRLLTTLSAAILNFSRWAVVRDPAHENRYAIEITGAEPFEDIHLVVIESFMNAMMVGKRNARAIWVFERPAPDRVRYRMTRDLAVLEAG